MEEHVVPLDVAHEVDGHVREDLERFLGEFVALDVLAADGDQADARLFDVLEHLRVDFAEDGELREVQRRAVGVRAGVDQDEPAADGRHEGRDGGAVDALQNAHLDLGRRHGRAGVTGGDDGVGLAFGGKRGADRDGGVFLCADRGGRGFAHFDDFLGVDELEARTFLQVFFLKVVGELFQVADEQDFHIGEHPQGVSDGFDHDGGRVIAAHCINRDPHRNDSN